MENNQIQPIHIVAQELSEKTIELATYRLAYENVNQENKELKKENEELKELKDVSVSAGSACSAGSVQISPVLSAMFKGETSRLEESVRLSFGMGSTKEDIDAFVDALR